MSKRRYFSGPSVERALLQAARHYDVEPDKIKYEKVEKAAGLNKRRGVVVKVDPEDYLLSEEERAAAAAAPVVEVAEEAPPAEEEAPAEEAADEVEEEPEIVEPAAASADEESEEPVEEAEAEPAAEDGTEETENEEAAAEEPAAEEPAAEEPTAEEPTAEGPAVDEAPAEEVEIAAAEESSSGAEESAEASRVAVSAAPSGELRALPTPLAVTQSREPAEGEEADAARAGLEKLFTLAGLELESVVAEGDEGRLEIDLAGPDAEVVVEEDGEVLLALQHLLPRVMQSALGRVVQCRLDCQGFHAVREEKLRDLALQTAGEVSGEGRPRTLHPMHPADRRIVHLALAEDPGVVTESVGSGYFKRVKVRSA
ncbi:MAG: R3H domain-containing nucleic acid-binding protein [Acidobacteriota bacterium]